MKIAVVTDSSAGINKKEEQDLGIHVARMPLTIDGMEYIEEIDIKRDAFIERMIEGALVQTSQPSMGYLVEMFDRLFKEYDHIIFVPISKHLSGAFQTAYTLAQDYEKRITVVDAEFISAPLKHLCVQIKKMVEAGYTPERIKNLVEEEGYMWAALIPEDLKYLKRGGRVKPAVAALANMMKIVPILKVEDGEIDIVDKVRTFKKAVQKGMRLTIDNRNIEDYDFLILKSGSVDKIYDKILKEMEQELGIKVIEDEIHPIVMAHTGPNTIGVVLVKKLDKGL